MKQEYSFDYIYFARVRQRISSEESSMTEVLNWYTSVNAALLDHLTNQIKETDSSGVWRYLLAFKNLLRSIESTGIASVYGVNYFGRGWLVSNSYVHYIHHDAVAKDLLNGSLNYVPMLKGVYRQLTNSMSNYGTIKRRYDSHSVVNVNLMIILWVEVILLYRTFREIQISLRQLTTSIQSRIILTSYENCNESCDTRLGNFAGN